MRLWDAKTARHYASSRGLPLGHIRGHSPDGHTLVAASQDNSVRLWDAKTGQELRVLKGHADLVTSVSFSPDGQVLASASRDHTLKLWDGKTGQELRRFKGTPTWSTM